MGHRAKEGPLTAALRRELGLPLKAVPEGGRHSFFTPTSGSYLDPASRMITSLMLSEGLLRAASLPTVSSDVKAAHNLLRGVATAFRRGSDSLMAAAVIEMRIMGCRRSHSKVASMGRTFGDRRYSVLLLLAKELLVRARQ